MKRGITKQPCKQESNCSGSYGRSNVLATWSKAVAPKGRDETNRNQTEDNRGKDKSRRGATPRPNDTQNQRGKPGRHSINEAHEISVVRGQHRKDDRGGYLRGRCSYTGNLFL